MSVKEIMPRDAEHAKPVNMPAKDALLVTIDIACVFRATAELTAGPYKSIIMLTQQPAYWHRAAHGQETKPRSQVPCTPARGLLASPSRASHRRTVFNSRIFRSSRPGSGQVRDAAPGAKRGTGCEPVGSPLRLLASLVLSSAGCVPTGRSAGTDATEAGAEKSAQAHRRSACFRPPGTAGRSFPAPCISSFISQRQVRHHRSSTQHRARFDAQSKKTAVNEDPPHSIPQQDWVAHYEQLRSDALNQGHGISSGFGLTVFLRQGMTAWMRACFRAVTPPARECAPSSPVSSLPDDVRTQAVFILAGILLGDRSEDNQCKPTYRR